ncbi:SDR family NAD(P)-dependent oxidoreductase [Mycobacterium sp. NPDC006124]|uniref:SDR family NAD(P)-dependent oxidoreductase n=1 Tax=Mycobacterium sp. NPDC006124 TaxID=3156729 RepID=UPI0033A72368
MNAPVSTARPRVVVITGASSGIGRETALRYAARRDRLVLASRTESMLQTVAEECLTAGARDVVVQPTDIGEFGEVQQLFDVAVAAFGRVDVAVQCAAITAFGRFEDLPEDVFERIIRTNLIGAANVARCALAHFRIRGDGHLVLVGSLLGRVAVPYQSAYVASKFALNGLVRSLRQENRGTPGVRVHGVYPGPVDTPVYATSVNYLEHTPRVPPSADAPATVAKAIVGETDRGRSTERNVGWVNIPAILVYYLLPGVFDALVGPLVRATLFTTAKDAPRAPRRLRPG